MDIIVVNGTKELQKYIKLVQQVGTRLKGLNIPEAIMILYLTKQHLHLLCYTVLYLYE